MPVQALGDRSTNERAARHSQAPDAAPNPDDGATPFRRKRAGQERQAERHDHGRTETLNRASRDQQACGWRDRAGRRGNREKPQPERENPTSPNAIANRGRRDDAGGEREREGVDRPFQHRQTGMQVTMDRRQGSNDHERVEGDHEEGNGSHCERPDRLRSTNR